jgi:hypothetical protein
LQRLSAAAAEDVSEEMESFDVSEIEEGYLEGGLRSRTRRAAIRTSEKAIRTSGDGLGRDSADVSDAGEAIRTSEKAIRTRTKTSRTFGTRLGQ